MDIDELIEAIRLCGSSPTIYQCEACAYYTGGDMGACIPEMTAQAADVLSALRGELEHVTQKYETAVKLQVKITEISNRQRAELEQAKRENLALKEKINGMEKN